MPSDQEIRDLLRSWVLTKAPDLSADAFTDRTLLFEERHLRSVHLPELLLLLERLRAAPIDVEDLRPGDFRDIRTMVDRFGGPGVTP
ncbi:hypothetical protein QMK19_34875 [Streptomyces sp. H10-C2]|uniref:hypothetical protein n=1 Tax=unclassified Streptomyces TaxID=2593676 RepID=UPI0024B8BD1E|nr:MULTISPECIES: hypothetical protein [unclassified Streptomyces]MDJ0345779.1 hypothetical protein [Streptomyces sp. PH10-H1]MDJ0374669.1 hypothetical protein [Streptomyces sp. H10-C2]